MWPKNVKILQRNSVVLFVSISLMSWLCVIVVRTFFAKAALRNARTRHVLCVRKTLLLAKRHAS